MSDEHQLQVPQNSHHPNPFNPRHDCQIVNLSHIYYDYFGALTNGTFLEIGAFDGRTVSNTCFLADIGWSGYYIEPVQEYALLCQFNHLTNNVRVIPCAISQSTSFSFISVGKMISSLRNDHIEVFNRISYFQNHHTGDIRKVPALSLTDLLIRLQLVSCDLLVVDVEGSEPEILMSYDFSSFRPRMIIVESRDNDQNFPSNIRTEYRLMLQHLQHHSYQIFHHDGCNVILVSQ